MKMTRYLVKSTIVGALGGLLFGFDTAVIAGTTQQLTTVFHLSSSSLGVTVFSGLVGTVIGALTAGVLGQRIGGREALRIMALLYTISALGCAISWSWSSLLVFRLIGGLGIGGSSVLGPVYIAELAPAKWRGRMVGLFQINVVAGILLAYLSNYLITLLHLGTLQWRWQLGVAGIPALLFLIMLYGIPRSSRWLVTQNKTDEALDVLKMMGSPDSEAELREIMDSIHMERGMAAEPLFIPRYRLPIFLAVTIGMFNQLSGINAILYYSNSIFAAAGFSQLSGSLQTVLIGAMNFLATLLGMSLIDKVGRKTLLLIGSVGTALCLSGVAAIFFTNTHQNLLVWLLMTYIAFFSISQGAVIWVYISEVFPNRVRAKGQSLGSSAHWIMNALISLVFPILAARSGGIPFVFFAAMMALQFVIVLRFYPEGHLPRTAPTQTRHQLETKTLRPPSKRGGSYDETHGQDRIAGFTRRGAADLRGRPDRAAGSHQAWHRLPRHPSQPVPGHAVEGAKRGVRPARDCPRDLRALAVSAARHACLLVAGTPHLAVAIGALSRLFALALFDERRRSDHIEDEGLSPGQLQRDAHGLALPLRGLADGSRVLRLRPRRDLLLHDRLPCSDLRHDGDEASPRRRGDAAVGGVVAKPDDLRDERVELR
jgi:SP family arabinose:H+ symporter-like MFS transporter